MKKIVIAVLGCDRPGIIATVSRTLFEQGCNIEDVSQTILQTEFVGIFIASAKEEIGNDALLSALRERLEPMGLHLIIKPLEESLQWDKPPSEPFVITTVGPDRPGLVAGVTEVLARYGANITDLKAVFRGPENPSRNVMFYEIEIPLAANQRAFRKDLKDRAGELGIEITVQHRDIFEEVHRV